MALSCTPSMGMPRRTLEHAEAIIQFLGGTLGMSDSFP
jgi:hypothetical protein